jgi:hypothetical protein
VSNIVFLDTETTGLDPTKSALLELAFVVTDEALTPLAQAEYIWPNDTPIQDLHAAADPKVQKMHTDNGLWFAAYQEQINRLNQTRPCSGEVDRSFRPGPATLRSCPRSIRGWQSSALRPTRRPSWPDETQCLTLDF